MQRKKKPKMEFRYYRMPQDIPILALLGQKWNKPYGDGSDCLHFHNYLEVGYCHEGTGVLTLGEKSYPYSAGTFTIIPKNYPHTTDSDPGTESYWEYVFVDADKLLKELYKDNTNRVEYMLYKINFQALLHTADDSPKLAGLIKELLDIMRGTDEFYVEEAKACAVTLLINIAREIKVGKDVRKMTKSDEKLTLPIATALDYISQHYMEPLKVGDLAEWCHTSETHFRRVFTAYMNMGPLEYINLVRVQTACDFLKRTNDSVADIATKCGFATPSTFNRNFKMIIGLSPNEWRRRPENFEQQLFKFNIRSEEGW